MASSSSSSYVSPLSGPSEAQPRRVGPHNAARTFPNPLSGPPDPSITSVHDRRSLAQRHQHQNQQRLSSHHQPTSSQSTSGSSSSPAEGLGLRKTDTSSAPARHYNIRSALGLHAHAPIKEEHAQHQHHDLWWSRVRLVLREPFAEFWGVFVMVMFGNGSVAQVLLSENLTSAPGGMGYGGYQSISWGWGLGVMLGIYVAGDSGAFLNPAITLAFSVYRGLPYRRFFMYLIAQFLGGFVASGVVYANYISAIDNYAGAGVRTVPPATTSTAQIFCTYPASFLGKTNQFFSEFITSTLLIFVIFALKDTSNLGDAGPSASTSLFPLAMFFVIFGIGACFGYETGYAVNLARDFGPRLMSYCLGYGTEVWTAGDYYFWVPIVGSFTGCIFGGFLYDVFLYTGPESPVNTPWMGLGYLFNPKKAVHDRWEEREPERLDEVGPNEREIGLNVVNEEVDEGKDDGLVKEEKREFVS